MYKINSNNTFNDRKLVTNASRIHAFPVLKTVLFYFLKKFSPKGGLFVLKYQKKKK